MSKEKEEKKLSVKSYKNKILVFINKSNGKPLPRKELAAKCKTKKGDSRVFQIALDELFENGLIFEKKKGILLSARLGFFPAVLTRLQKTFGFAKREDDETDVFIPGKFLMGAMPNERILVHLIPSRSGSPEGEVVRILTKNTQQLTGMVEEYDGRNYLLPDTMSKSHILLTESNIEYKAGDKVLAEIVYRGLKHADHKAKVIYSFGSADKASSCAMSILLLNGIETKFPDGVINEAKKIAFSGINEYDFHNRLDLRDKCIFTIDGADTKDIDDAISIDKNPDGSYALGVHIADVSHYVHGNSELDKEALNRGTSVYYANRVVPMLPKELSNDICSLNPQVDRLAFSCLMDISADGILKSYKFKKSVIRSRVKGVYSEINTILAGNETEQIKAKYADVREGIVLMEELADILTANKRKRGAPEIETSESKLIISEDDICIDVQVRTRGKSEMIIEEFMLMANQSAATLAKEKEVPFVYRVHEPPSLEKIDKLKETLTRMNIEYPPFSNVKPAHLASILNTSKESPLYPVINIIVLRSMSKAKYAPDPIGHFGLALEDYAHFTSPIRRYPDLAIHRILTDIAAGYDKKWLDKRYSSFVVNSSEHSTQAELKAMTVERDCEDCYKAEFMQKHLGEEMEGTISGVTEYGFYIELPNTVEGLVHIHTMPNEIFEYDGMLTLSATLSGKKYTLGEKVNVKCTKADVNSGNIDFEVC